MQGIHNYIPETNHVPRQYSVAAVLQVTIHSVCNTISSVKSFVPLH
jgi:hypothetical protein